MSNSRSLWPCQFFQAGNCQDAQCPFVHQFAGFSGQLQGPGPGLLPTPGPAPLMSEPLMDMSGPMARVGNSVPSQMRPGIQCRFELSSGRCFKKYCKFFHRNKKEKSLNSEQKSPKTKSLTHPETSNQTVSDAQKQTIMREVLEDHISPYELAQKYNLSPNTIRGWMRKAGKKFPRVSKTLNSSAGQSLSVDKKGLDLDGTSLTQQQKDMSVGLEQKISSTELSRKNFEQKKSDLVDGPITSLPEPSPTVINKKTNMLRVIDEKLLKEPDKVNADAQKKNSFMEYREHGVIAQQKTTATEKRKINPKEQLEGGKEQPLKIVRSATLILEDEEQPMKKVKLCNRMTGIGESSKENTYFKQMFNLKPKTLQKLTEGKTEVEQSSIVLYNHLERCKYQIVKKYDGFSYHHKKLPCVLEGEVVTVKSYCSVLAHKNCPFIEVKDVLNNIGFIHQDCLGDKEIPFPCPVKKSCGSFPNEEEYLNHLCRDHFYDKLVSFLKGSSSLSLFKCPESSCNKSCSSLENLIFHYGAIPHEKVLSLVLMDSNKPVEIMSSESEVIVVGESESVDDIKKENDGIRKQLEEVQKERNALLKENEEFKTKVAQYQKGAMVWNGTLARSKTDLADERKKSAQKSNKISQLSKEKIAKEKKLTDELNDLKKQIENRNNDVEKERDQLDSDLMDLKEEKSKQDVIIEELKLKIQKLERGNKNPVKMSKKELINQARTAKVKQIENWEELNLKIQKLEQKEENEESRQDLINQAGKLKIRQIEKTLQERKEVWLKKIELYKEKLATKEEKTNELQELLEIKEVDLTNMKNDLEAMEKERDDLDSTLVDLRAELGEKELIIVQLESKQNDNREVEEMLTEVQNTKDQKIKQLHEKLKEKSDLFKQQTVVIKKLNSQKAELENSKNELNKRVEETKSILTVKQEEIEIMKKNIDELKSKLEEQKSGSTLINLEKQNNNLKDELSKHQIDVLNLQNEIKTQEERIKKYKEMFLNLANSM